MSACLRTANDATLFYTLFLNFCASRVTRCQNPLLPHHLMTALPFPMSPFKDMRKVSKVTRR